MKKQGEQRLSLVCRAVVYQLCGLLALQPAHPAFAEGIAVATGNTTLNQAGNGVPIVDIATPNGAGLSHNLYQDFNVGQAGVILNNATGQLTQTQLGGLIQNNPHLNGQAANLIINEVVGANPSQLQGYLEVAGQQAGVVVANPNGLTCDGCGFINTPNVTLSTGKPVLDAQGQLQALDVKQGTLTVGGKGLDATRQASVDLVARAVQLNGALHGQTVNVVAGANKVDRQTGDIVAQAGNGPAPEVAIDTAALGGMYAGKIRLVSTEQGVGVNLANVVAKQGDLTLDANGRVRLRDSSSAGNLQVSSQGELAVTGAIHSGGAAKLAAGDEFTAQDADIAAKGVATLKAHAQQLQRTKVSSGGTLALQANDALVVREGELQGEILHVTAQQLDTQSALTAKEVTLQAEQLRQAGNVQGTSVRLAAGALRHEGMTQAAQNLTIDATTLDNQGTLKSGQAMIVALGERGHNAGELSAGDNLAIQAGTRWEQGEQGKSNAGQRLQLQAQQVSLGGGVGAPTLDINANELTVAGKVKGNAVQLQARGLINRGEVQAGQTLNWQGSRLANSGTLQGDKQLVLKGDALQNQGSLAGGDSLTLQADTLDNEGRIASQLATLTGRQLRSSGTLLGVSRLTLKGDELALTGQQLTDGELELGSRLLQLSGQSLVGGQARVTAETGNFDGVLKAQSLVLAVKDATSEGKLHSREGIAWEGQRIATGSASELLANQGVSLSGDQLALGGTVGAGQDMAIKGRQVTQHGQLASGQVMKVNADELALAGQVQGRAITLTSERATQQGRILATNTLNWHSKQLDGNGWLQAGQALNLDGERLAHSGTAVTAGKLALTFAELNSTGGLFANDVAVTGSRLLLKGALESKSSAQITADELQLGGELRTGADLALGATLLTLSGTQHVGGNLQLQAEQADVSGELEVGKQLKLDAKTLASSGKLLANQADIAAVNWQQHGELTTDNALVWRGDKLTQEAGGALRAGGVLNLSGDDITLAGDVAAKGDVAVVANAYQQQGAMNAAQGLRIDATRLQLDGTTQAKAAQLHSQVGSSRGQHLIGQQLNWLSDTLVNQGWLQAGESLALAGRTLDNEGTVIAGGDHQLNATERLTNQGNLAGKTLSLTTKELQNGGLLQGKQGITLQAAEATLTGRLASQGAVLLGAKLLALGGNANIAGALTLQGETQQLAGVWRVGGLLQSTGKQLTLAGDWQAGQWQLQADALTNKGRLASEQAANFKVTEWHNEQGATLVAAGPLNLTGQRLLQQGSWLGNGSQTLMVDEITQQGQWLGDGALQVKGSTLVNSGTLRAAGLDLAVNELENRSRMESGEELNWQGTQWRNLGALLAGHASLTGDTLLNSGDMGTRQLTMKAAARLDNRGVLVGKEGINLTAAALDSQGDMLSNGSMQLGASLLNLNGLTQANGELVVTAEQAALAGSLAADQLQWRGKTLVMSGTAAARDTTLNGEQVTLDGTLKGEHQQVTATTLTTGLQSQLLAKAGQQLTAGQLTLQGSAVAGGAQRIEATRLSQQGTLASGGSLSLQVADTLRNDGKVSAQAITLTAAHIDNGGALVSKDALNLKTGTLTNRGHWQSDQGITLTASRLLNSGQWVSGLGQTLTLDTLDSSGTLLAGADLTINAPQLSSSGKLLANKDLVLNTNEATLGSGSTTASNGQLQLHAGTLTSQGTLSSAGDLSWQGANLVHSGSAVTNGALTLRGESVTLDGDLQGERVLLDTGTLTSRGKLTSRGDLAVNARGAVQHHGQLQGNQVVLRSASWQGSGGVGSGGALELRTGQLQLAGPWRIRGEADIQADAMTLGGSLVSGGNLTLASRGALTSQAGSQLVSGGALSLDGGTLTQQGLWQSARGMSLKGSRFEQQGDLLAGGDLLLRSGYWQQGGKTRANGGLNAELTEGATLAGTVQADGNATLSAPALTLKGTLAAKGSVALSANTLISQLGNLLSGGELAMNATRIEQQGRVETTRLQSGGALQNDGVMLVTGQGSISGARLDNRGTLQGDGLTISSRQLDNRGALLGNTLTLTHDTLVNRGRLQGGTLSLTTQQLDNSQGAVLRGQHAGDITATTLTNAGELSSAGQLLLKGNQLDNSGLISANLLEASPLARLANSGTLFGQQLTLRSGELYAPGKILAGQKATLDAGRVTGIGEWLSGGDLVLKTGSSLTSQGTLSAKGTLDLQVQGDWQHQGQWGAGQRFNAGVTGQLNNRGALVSNGVMQLGAQRLENSGSVQSGQGLMLNTQGELRNTGMLASLGNLGWQGESLFNGGTVYSGGSQALTANSNITNEYGAIIAEQNAGFKIKNGSLINSSGVIESAEGDVFLYANNVTNRRAVFEITESQIGELKGKVPVALSEYYSCMGCAPDDLVDVSTGQTINNFERGNNKSVYTIIIPVGSGGKIKSASSQSVINARKAISIHATSLNNDASSIYSGTDMTFHVGNIYNKSYSFGDVSAIYKETKMVVHEQRDYSYSYFFDLVDIITSNTESNDVKSTISAGGNLTGTVAGMIDNVTIKAHAGPVSSTTQRPSVSLPQAQGAGAAPSLQGDAQYLSQVLKPVGPDNGVPLPDFQLPSGDKGLFTINGNSDSPYLIEVNPLLANLGQAGNGMMDRIDAALQQQLQGAGPLSFEAVSGSDGVARVTGHGTDWVLPGRTSGGVNSPELQLPSGMTPSNSGHITTAGQWQQSLQPGWQAPVVSAGAVKAPGPVQTGLQTVPALATRPQIEISPTLTQVDKFLGSSYFFGQVNFAPEKDIKLLGDAAFDTRVIRDAVLAQTGRRFINGEMGSDLAQMRWLIDNAAQNQRELGLAPGVALTAAQVAQLGRSMVWWEPVWFNGQIVLAPKLYLTEADKRHLSGSVITAGNIDLKAGGINNSGTLLADGTLSLKSGSTLTNLGALQAGGDLTLLAMDDILNQGQISGQNVALASANGSIINQTQTAQRHVDVNGILSDVLSDQTRFSRTDVGDTASITSAGNLLLQAGKDINLSAAELLAGGNMSLQAGNDITIGSLESRHTWEEGQNRFSRIDQLMSELNAGGNLSLSAGNDLSLVASTAEANGDVSLRAGNNLVLASEANQTSDDVRQGNKHTIDRSTTQVGATVSGDNVSLSAGNNLLAQASTIEAQGNASLQAGGELQLLTADNEAYHFEKSKSKSTFKSKSTEIEQKDVTAQGTTITAGGNVSLASQGDMTLKGSDIKAADSLAIDTDGQLKLLTATDEHFYRKDEKKSGVMVKMSGNGINSTTERQNQLDGADINISAGQGVLLQVGQKEGESLQAELDKLATQPGMAWVEQVRSMPGVKMEAVQEAYEQWNYSQQSLSPIASSIIAIALAVATGGVGAAALGAAQGTATAAMANAAFSTLVSQATISTINNGGNLGAVLKELGSSASVKQLATSVATAGALQGLDKAMGLASAAPAASNAASQPAASNLFSWDTFNRVTSHSVVTAGINTTINGSHFADAFKASLLSNIQGEVGKATANWIGDQGIKFDAANSPLAEAGKIAAHGVTSGAIAEITGGKFAAGAAGGAMSELASSWSSQVFSDTEHQVALNKVLGGLAAVAVTGDQNQFDTGTERAETVYRYNYLTHKQITDWLDKYGSAATPEERERLLSAAQQVDKVQLEKALQTAISKDALIAQQDDLMQLIQSADCNPSCKALSQHSLNQLTPIIDGYEELERGNNIPKAVIATISLGIPAFSKVVAPTVGKWVGSATIGERLVGVGISGAANAGTQIYYGEPFSWVTFGASMVTGGATVNMGYWGATTVNAAGSGITSLIEQKSPWRSMAASVIGSTVGYGVGKAEKPLDKFFNPPKNDIKWMQSPNTPIFYPYPKSNLPAIIAGSGSAVLSEVTTHATEDSMRLYEVLK
ncbi:filamentous hemagglutinin N-terminal domain-containing protein [Aeromonas jandaei]|nr:filamentous hemagglutinin N-terminal domain-containing protein [Aeromonas jandaei]